jgi:FdhD protein
MTDIRRTVTPARVVAVRPDRHLDVPDQLATEEPMEIRAAGPGQEPQAVAVTMRTPGHDFELAVGFLRTEGLIDGLADVAAVKYCELLPDAEQQFNIVTVSLTRRFVPAGYQRAFCATSSCGTCGKASLDQVQVWCPPVVDQVRVAASLIPTLPDRLRQAQRLFDQTGGLHAASTFDAEGRLGCLREDVGRHNAVDKVVGRALLDGLLPARDHVVVVSGRGGYEIVQKAIAAGIPIVAAVGAPSSLALATALRFKLTLVGFLRGGGFNVYSSPERLKE